ncbi:MAG: hypothetical protein ACJA1I_000178 [Zhongshania marina]
MYSSTGWKNDNHIKALEKNFGVTSSKTLRSTPSKFVKSSHAMAFSAGLFAGDGHIRSGNNGHLTHMITAARHCADWLLGFYEGNGINAHFTARKPKQTAH